VYIVLLPPNRQRGAGEEWLEEAGRASETARAPRSALAVLTN